MTSNYQDEKIGLRIWIARCLITLVVIDNLQAAILFLLKPSWFSPSFELTGAAGDAVIQGIGLLFAMWTVPYGFAMVEPVKNRISLIEALLMQTIGLVGESVLLYLLPAGHEVLTGAVGRFIVFDGAGLALLLAAFFLTRKIKDTGS